MRQLPGGRAARGTRVAALRTWHLNQKKAARTRRWNGPLTWRWRNWLSYTGYWHAGQACVSFGSTAPRPTPAPAPETQGKNKKNGGIKK
jgi:hypothetical protein